MNKCIASVDNVVVVNNGDHAHVSMIQLRRMWWLSDIHAGYNGRINYNDGDDDIEVKKIMPWQ